MDENSKQRGYLTGILVMLSILFIGYVLNPIIGILGIVQLVWPQNLYFILLLTGIGMAIGLLSESVNKKATDIRFILPSFFVLGILALIVLVWPNGLESAFVNKALNTPALFLSVFVYLAGGAFVSAKIRSFKKQWSSILTMIAFLLFCYSTIVAQRDYYNLSMQIGEERALFEADDEDGKFYRLPFAVKLLPNEDGVNTTMVRFFNTVEDFTDVALGPDKDYRLKGWIIKLEKEGSNKGEEIRLVGLNLVFDRWIELKYISLGLLIVSLIIRLRF